MDKNPRQEQFSFKYWTHLQIKTLAEQWRRVGSKLRSYQTCPTSPSALAPFRSLFCLRNLSAFSQNATRSSWQVCVFPIWCGFSPEILSAWPIYDPLTSAWTGIPLLTYDQQGFFFSLAPESLSVLPGWCQGSQCSSTNPLFVDTIVPCISAKNFSFYMLAST